MESNLTIGTIAELHQVKGLDILLQAWSKFITQYPETKLEILGTGEEEKNLKLLAHELGIEESVIFRGYVPEARNELPRFDIFVLPSRSEALPYVVLEAGLASRPIIASAVGGIPEIIEDGVDGLLVKPENAEILFSSLKLLAEDPLFRARLGQSVKEKILKAFSKEKMIEQTFALYLR